MERRSAQTKTMMMMIMMMLVMISIEEENFEPNRGETVVFL